MKKGIIIFVSAAVVVIGGVIIAGSLSNKSTSENSQDPSSQTDSSTAPTGNLQQFTMADVAKHQSETDCWTVVSGEIYDITRYIPRHPGGKEILRACGNDATTLFNSRTTAEGEQVGSGSPSFH